MWASDDLLVTLANVAESGSHLWSVPGGKRVRTIDFGGPSFWQVGPRLLLAETMESGSVEDPGVGLLRSWTLPDGEPVVLGQIDWKQLGTSTTFFAPDGRSWFYVKDRDLYSRPLPIGSGPDRLFARLRAKLVGFWPGADWLAVADESGETYFWSFRPHGSDQEKVIPRPETASSRVLPDPSGRWLSGFPAQDKQIRVWDLTAWKEARPLSLRRSASWYGAMSRFHPTGDWV
ncbi:MAG: hypothetical protein ACRD3V_01140, partial [Vicinamibacteria bacterium]